MQTSQIYAQVVENVIEKMQNDFINSGIDETVLSDLRDLWLAKLKISLPNDYIDEEEEEDPLFNTISFPYQSYQMPPSQASPSVSYPLPPPSSSGQPTTAAAAVHSNAGSPTDNTAQARRSKSSQQQQKQSSSGGNKKQKRSTKRSPSPTYDDEDDEDYDSEEEEYEEEQETAAPTAMPPQSTTSPTVPEETVRDDDELGSDLDDDDDDINGSDAGDNDANNRILCQFEKVTRSRNKWKCILKDSVVSMNGRDYIFHRIQCDFEF